MKTCPQCKQTKPFSDYGKHKKNKDGLCTYCKDCHNKKGKEYYAKNRNKIKEHRGRPEIKERYNEYKRNRRKNNPQERLSIKMSQETNYTLLGVYTDMTIVSEQYAIERVGLTSPQYRAYIESLWEEGMSWDNYGRGESKWCIDHIIPKKSFDLTDPAQYKKCSHYTNTQPMWLKDNMTKGGRLLAS